MDSFDNAIHYGPNDAGASAISIALVVLGILAFSWAFGAVYALFANYFNRMNDSDE